MDADALHYQHPGGPSDASGRRSACLKRRCRSLCDFCMTCCGGDRHCAGKCHGIFGAHESKLTHFRDEAVCLGKITADALHQNHLSDEDKCTCHLRN